MKRKMEIRKKFKGSPKMGASIVVEDLGFYLLGPRGELLPCPSIKENRLFVFSLAANTPITERTRKNNLKKTNALGREVIIQPNLVLFSPDNGSLYLFNKFTKKYAVFKYLRDA